MGSQLHPADALGRLSARQPFIENARRSSPADGGSSAFLEELRAASRASRAQARRPYGASDRQGPEEGAPVDETATPADRGDRDSAAAELAQAEAVAVPQTPEPSQLPAAALVLREEPCREPVRGSSENPPSRSVSASSGAHADAALPAGEQPASDPQTERLAEGQQQIGPEQNAPFRGAMAVARASQTPVVEEGGKEVQRVRVAPSAVQVPAQSDGSEGDAVREESAQSETSPSVTKPVASKLTNEPRQERQERHGQQGGERQAAEMKPAEPKAPVAERVDPAVGRQTKRDQRVDAWLDQRREGGEQGAEAGAKQRDATAQRQMPLRFVAAGYGLQAVGADSSESLGAVRLGDVSGDSAAASVAQFLLNAPGGQPHAGPTAGAGMLTSGGVSHALNPSASNSTTATSFSAALGHAAGAAASGATEAAASGPSGAESLDGAIRVLSASNGEGRFHVTMQLEPPELGQLRVQVRVQQHAMTLQVDAESSSVARLITSRMSELREALASHGIRVERADVVVKSPASSESSPQGKEGGHPPHGGQNGGAASQDASGQLADGRAGTAFGREDERNDAWGQGWGVGSDEGPGADEMSLAVGREGQRPMSDSLLDLVA